MGLAAAEVGAAVDCWVDVVRFATCSVASVVALETHRLVQPARWGRVAHWVQVVREDHLEVEADCFEADGWAEDYFVVEPMDLRVVGLAQQVAGRHRMDQREQVQLDMAHRDMFQRHLAQPGLRLHHQEATREVHRERVMVNGERAI